MKNVVRKKSFRFALRVVKLCNYLQKTKHESVMTRQLLRCGTSIGANVAESEHAQSRADFLSKLNIALKEAAETDYWLRLLHEAATLVIMSFNRFLLIVRKLKSFWRPSLRQPKNNFQFSTFNFQLTWRLL